MSDPLKDAFIEVVRAGEANLVADLRRDIQNKAKDDPIASAILEGILNALHTKFVGAVDEESKKSRR